MEQLDQSFSSIIEYTSRNMRRYATGRLQRIGLTVDQWGVLKLLEEMGGAAAFGDLSARLLRDKPTLTRIVDILVRERWVVRDEDPEDRRRIRVRLTGDGVKTVEKAAILVSQLRGEVIEGVTSREQEALRSILAKINQNIEAARDLG